MRERKARLLLLTLLFCLPLSIVLSIGSGVVSISFIDTVRTLAFELGLPVSAPDPQQQLILSAIRLPRTLLAALVGACLALCGAAMQGLFRNPLADPTLIGVSSGASVGAAVAIVLGSTLLASMGGFVVNLFGDFSTMLSAYLVSVFGFAGGFVATLVVYRLGTTSSGTSVSTMLLAGIAINALAAAITNAFSYVADEVALRRITLWRMGSLDGANWEQVIIAATLLGLVLVSLPRYSKSLNALLLGESEARHLGVRVDRIKWQLIAWTALGVGVAVSVSGVIGFVGLVVPHLVRLMIGPDHRSLMPAAMLLGAVLLVLADCVSRSLVAPAEIPIGIVTALLGAPFFISLLLQQRQRLLR